MSEFEIIFAQHCFELMPAGVDEKYVRRLFDEASRHEPALDDVGRASCLVDEKKQLVIEYIPLEGERILVYDMKQMPIFFIF